MRKEKPTPLAKGNSRRADLRSKQQAQVVPAFKSCPVTMPYRKGNNTINNSITNYYTTMNVAYCKNKENNATKNDEQQLLKGLPNHLAERCLSTLKPSLLFGVCKLWRNFIYSPSFSPFLCLYAVLYKPNSSISFACFDPIANRWRAVPKPPSEKPLCIQRKHSSYISRILPIQSVTVSGRLVLVAATCHRFQPALSHPLIFDPLSSKWYSGPPFSAPRRWCVAGSMHGTIYVASGAGAQYHGEVARSLEKWDMSKTANQWNWEKMASYKDGRFSREAVEALGYKNKLCMVNIKGKSVKEGALYDVVMNKWEDMPRGMLLGWNGPAAVDVDDDQMYVVDQESGSVSRYHVDGDRWQVLVEGCGCLRGAEHVSVFRGKICAAFGDGSKIAVADVKAEPARIWVVEPPQGMEAIGVHILPRMSVAE